MTAVALLTLESIHAGRLRLAARRSEALVLDLLRGGQVAAARRAAAFLGGVLPDRVRVAVVRAGHPDEVLRQLDSVPAAGQHLLLGGQLRASDAAGPPAGGTCCLLLRDEASGAGWLRGLIDAVPGSSGVLAGPADLDHVADSLRRAQEALRDAAPGTCADLGWDRAAAPLDTPELRAWARRRLAAIDDDDDLVATVAAVLRWRSELDAARALAVHRHTVRNRVTRIESQLGVTLADPDVRSEIWLALRLTGRC
jgi:purine catabolism regulator